MGTRTMRALGCALAALAGQGAHAQTTEPSPGAMRNAPADDVGDIVVTARQREESLKDVPISVTAISGDTLKQQQIYQVKDVAAYAPGLNINSDSVGRAFVSMRGVGTTLIDTVQPGVGIFIDGIYQPNTSYLNSPLVDVARVEVLKGPQGTLFGNNTLGGAINVITRQPSNQFELRADGAWAPADDSKSISGSVSGPIVKDMLQVRIGGAYHHQDGFEYNTLADGYANPLTQKSGNGTVRFEPAQWATFTLNANYDRVSGGNTPYVQVTGPTDYTLNTRTNQLSLATITYKGANLKGEFDAAPINTRITAVLAYNRKNLTSNGDGDFEPADVLRSSGFSHLTTKTGELRFDTKWTDAISTLVGVFADHAVTDASATSQLNLTSPPRVSTVASRTLDKNEAVFGTVFIKLGAGFDLAAGGRYDHQHLSVSTNITAPAYTANNFQPRVTLTKHWDPDFMTYASVAKGVRGGGQNGPGAPNLIYRGDEVWTYELGTKFATPNRVLSVNADVFYNDYSHFIGQNALAPSTSGVGFVAINLNTGHVTSYGFEAEAHLRPTSNWRIDGGVTLLHARITNDDEFFRTTGTHVSTDHVIFTPDWNFNIGTNYTVPLGRNALVFDAGVVAKGSRYGSSLDPNSAPKLASYALVNGSITFKLGSGLSLAVFTTNLFDKKYTESYIDKAALVRVGLASIATNLALPGDRRRVGVRASIRY